MTDDAEWGPWVDHDGKGCPCVGALVRVELGVLSDGYAPEDDPGDWEPGCHVVSPRECITIAKHGPAWNWEDGWFPISRYRIRKPKALRDLITIAADPYAPPPVISPEGPLRQPAPVPA